MRPPLAIQRGPFSVPFAIFKVGHSPIIKYSLIHYILTDSLHTHRDSTLSHRKAQIIMDQATQIGLAGTVGTWVGAVGGVGVTTAVGVVAYKQNARNTARNNASLPTMEDMTQQRRADDERRRRALTQEQRDAEQRESQSSLAYEVGRANNKQKRSAQAKMRATAPAAPSSSSSSSSFSSSPALPSTLPAAARRAENSKKQPKDIVRGPAPGQQSVPSRSGPVAAPAAAASGSDARGGANRRQNSATAGFSSKNTRRGTKPGQDDSFLDMSD